MKRNCDLTLHLVPPSFDDHQQAFIDEVKEDRKQNQTQQLTIFYDGKVNVCEVTDVQAKAIIKAAGEGEGEGEGEEIWRSKSRPLIESPVGLLMKKSLQRFLQKREKRIQGTSPYHH